MNSDQNDHKPSRTVRYDSNMSSKALAGFWLLLVDLHAIQGSKNFSCIECCEEVNFILSLVIIITF